MDDSQPNVWAWPVDVVGDLDEVVVLVLVLGALVLRLLPSTRRWAPRGMARSARPRAASRAATRHAPSVADDRGL